MRRRVPGSELSVGTLSMGVVVSTLALLGCARPTRDGVEIAGPAPRAPGRVAFLAVGDGGTGDAGQAKVAGEMERECARRGCDFVALLGDNLYRSGARDAHDEAFERLFERPYARLAVPFFAAIGNHDEGQRGLGMSFERGDAQVAYAARSAKWRMPARFYALRFDEVEIVVLDTNSLLYDRFVEAQRRRVREWLGGAEGRFRIVIGHHPLRSVGKHGDAGHYGGLPSIVPVAAGRSVRDFVEDEVCGKADLYLAGHDHNLQHLVEGCKGTELVVSGGGGKPSELVGPGATRFARAALGFFRVEVTRDAITLTAVVDGEDAYTHRILRARG